MCVIAVRKVARIAGLAIGGMLLSSVAADERPSEAVTQQPWQEVVVSVSDLDRTARFFVEIGQYEAKWRGHLHSSLVAAWELPEGASGEALVVGPPGYETGLVRLVRFDNAGERVPMRPGSRTWDTGCYFSMMVRMKNMPEIYRRAIDLGWWTETPVTPVYFRGSELRAVIYRGPDGVQVQGYERLTPPLPDSIPEFETMTGPFNMMQMVKDRDATHDFFTRVLGFESYYKGDRFVALVPGMFPASQRQRHVAVSIRSLFDSLWRKVHIPGASLRSMSSFAGALCAINAPPDGFRRTNALR